MGSDDRTQLTVRNITARPLVLRSVARFGKSVIADVEDAVAADPHQSGTTHHSPPSSGDADEVALTIAPFETLTTDKVLLSAGQHVRLTFVQRNEEHFLDLHVDRHESKDLAPATAATTTVSAETEAEAPQPPTAVAGKDAKDGDGRRLLSAVYYPSPAHVTVFAASSPASWMSALRNDTPISALSIPGTHNAPAYHHALPSVRCQAVAPRTQLLNGVRFLDVRVRVVDAGDAASDRLELVHAVFPVSLTGRRWFRALADDVHAFLAANPSETVLMTVKREGLGNASDAQLSRLLHDHYAGDPARWYTAPRVPYLGEVRGKIVLVRRFGLDDALRAEYGGAGWCLDASQWADNTPDALTGSGDLRVQDFYAVMRSSQIGTKTEYVTGLMAKTSAVVSALPATATATATATAEGAAPTPQASNGNGDGSSGEGDKRQPIHVNFLSASNFFNPRCWPEGIAAKLNPSVLEYLCKRHNEPTQGGGAEGEGVNGDAGQQQQQQQIGVGDGCTGVVVCDWVGYRGNWDLVRAIVGWNSRLEAREAGIA